MANISFILINFIFIIFLFVTLIQTQIWDKWSKFGPCSKSCGNDGIQIRTRECILVEDDYDINAGCEIGAVQSSRSFCTLRPCSALKWGTWSSYGPCSKTCGSDAIKTKTRKCVRVLLKDGDDEFDECIDETQESLELRCPNVACIVNGGWGPWTENWSVCESRNCSTQKGIQYKYRRCDSPRPENGGSMCQGLMVKLNTCIDPTNCPVDGGWGNWSEFNCVKEDGNFYARRSRNCMNPIPKYGGTDCDTSAADETIYRDTDKEAFDLLCPDFAPEDERNVQDVSFEDRNPEGEEECVEDCEELEDDGKDDWRQG